MGERVLAVRSPNISAHPDLVLPPSPDGLFPPSGPFLFPESELTYPRLHGQINSPPFRGPFWMETSFRDGAFYAGHPPGPLDEPRFFFWTCFYLLFGFRCATCSKSVIGVGAVS